jgi:uncharacterized protein YecA (UPF0149 family)
MKIKVRKIRGNEFSNKLCPCGSGKVYEKCCKKKKIKYEIHEDGYVKKIPMTDGVVGIIKEEEKLFKEYYNFRTATWIARTAFSAFGGTAS